MNELRNDRWSAIVPDFRDDQEVQYRLIAPGSSLSAKMRRTQDGSLYFTTTITLFVLLTYKMNYHNLPVVSTFHFGKRVIS